MPIPKACVSVTASAIIRGSEFGKSFYFLNPERQKHRWIVVDGCAISKGPRCDCALFLKSGREIYIEYKGTDVSRALEQLSASIEKLSECGRAGGRVCLVIASRVPAEDTSTQRMRLKMFRDFNVRITFRSKTYRCSEAQLFDSIKR